jgi:hypothetical protein
VPSPTPQSERRRAARALANFPVRLNPETNTESALLRDISEIGLACVAPYKLAEMTLVALDFSLPGSVEKHHCKGAVVRCAPLAKQKGKYDLAIYFTEITPVTRAALKYYVGKGKPA